MREQVSSSRRSEAEEAEEGNTRTKRWLRTLFAVFLLANLPIAALLFFRSSSPETNNDGSLSDNPVQKRRRLNSGNRPRILYIVTTLAEFNSGTRHTVRGSDRLQETLIPVVSEGVHSMVNAGYTVDVYLICHFVLKPERRELVAAALPAGTRLEVWNDATPLGYDTGKEPFEKLQNRTLHLARQHRFVIKDKILDYDIFVNFEDDMVIKAEHVQHFEAVTSELKRLEELAPDEPPTEITRRNAEKQYHGIMTKKMLKRMLPGFIRVEVLLNEDQYGAQSERAIKVPVDLDFDGTQRQVDSKTCCHVSDHLVSPNRPLAPPPDKLMLWETNILPLGVRKMPEDSWLDWVVMQRGPNQGNLNVDEIIGDYWTNRNKDFYDTNRRPAPQEFKYINNQGGWMATRQQLWTWHTEICPGGFLPPYDAPHYRFDGLDMRNVEWYSGGMQLSTVRHACNMQRIILLDPQHFSKSLIYHSANNKQRQLADKKEAMFSKANTLLGQLNTIKKRAEKEMKA